MNKKTQRITWIDLMKGLLMIMGHSFAGPHYQSHYGKIIYWFHLPAFFLISGFLFKPVNSINGLFKLIKKQFYRIVIPYISFLIAMGIYRYFVTFKQGLLTNKWIKNDLICCLKGGQFLPAPAGALWFLTCLLFTQILFAIILLINNSINFQIIACTICYILAHVQAWYFYNTTLPFAIDISLLAIVYFAVGYNLKSIMSNKTVVVMSYILSISYVFLVVINKFNYGLELWGHHYIDFIYDFIVPVTISIAIVKTCEFIGKIIPYKYIKIICEIGIYSLPIMALHSWINVILWNWFSYGKVMFIIIGTVASYIIAKLFSLNKILSFLFLGTNNIDKKIQNGVAVKY